MYLFFLTQSLLFIIFCIDDLEYMGKSDLLRYIFICNIIKVNHFIFISFSNSALHTFPAFIPYGYDAIPPKFCNLLSSLLLNAILVASSVNILCTLLLNLCFDLNIVFVILKAFFIVFKLKSLFYQTFFGSSSSFITANIIC